MDDEEDANELADTEEQVDEPVEVNHVSFCCPSFAHTNLLLFFITSKFETYVFTAAMEVSLDTRSAFWPPRTSTTSCGCAR